MVQIIPRHGHDDIHRRLKDSGKVGLAFGTYMNGVKDYEELECLQDNSPIFQVEVCALNKAVTLLHDIKELVRRAILCVDSQAALKVICNIYHKSTVVQETQEKMSRRNWIFVYSRSKLMHAPLGNIEVIRRELVSISMITEQLTTILKILMTI